MGGGVGESENHAPRIAEEGEFVELEVFAEGIEIVDVEGEVEGGRVVDSQAGAAGAALFEEDALVVVAEFVRNGLEEVDAGTGAAGEQDERVAAADGVVMELNAVGAGDHAVVGVGGEEGEKEGEEGGGEEGSQQVGQGAPAATRLERPRRR